VFHVPQLDSVADVGDCRFTMLCIVTIVHEAYKRLEYIPLFLDYHLLYEYRDFVKKNHISHICDMHMRYFSHVKFAVCMSVLIGHTISFSSKNLSYERFDWLTFSLPPPVPSVNMSHFSPRPAALLCHH
jgi:hypothetical protein